MTEHIRVPQGPVPVCDFCSATPVEWDYPARDLSHDDTYQGRRVTLNSSGEWAACEECHRLIERGDRDGLARRSRDRYAEQHGAGVLSLGMARRIHDAFWSNRQGPPTPTRER